MTQREHQGLGTTQCEAILARLEAAGGDWVPMPELAHASGAFAVHSRVSDLRSWGHVIDQRSERVGRRVLSFYRVRGGHHADPAQDSRRPREAGRA